MKKFLSTLLFLFIFFSFGNNVFASNITVDGQSQNTVVSYGMSQGFVIIIPADFIIDGQTNKATAEVIASNVMIPDGKRLEVSINGDDYVDSWELVDEKESNNRIIYNIGTSEGDNNITNNDVVLAVAPGEAYNTTKTTTLYFEVVDILTKAGKYSDTITFTVNVENAKLLGYSYNGTVLPSLPEGVDYSIYDFIGIGINDGIYGMIIASEAPIYRYFEGYVTNVHTGELSYYSKNTLVWENAPENLLKYRAYALIGDEWILVDEINYDYDDETSSFVHTGNTTEYTWTNKDILDLDNDVFVKGTIPIPVYDY